MILQYHRLSWFQNYHIWSQKFYSSTSTFWYYQHKCSRFKTLQIPLSPNYRIKTERERENLEMIAILTGIEIFCSLTKFMWPLLRYKFSGPNLISPFTKKYPYKPINYFGPHKCFLHTYHILPKYSPYYYPTWAPTNISHISLINYLGPSHKYYPLYPTYYPTWVFTKIIIILLPNWATKLYYLHQKSPNSFTLWAKPKKPNKTLCSGAFFGYPATCGSLEG